MGAEVLVVLALVLLNGFFAMSELALISARPAELRRLADHGSNGARTALKLMEDPSGMLSGVQIGITLVGIVAGAYSGATLGAHMAEWMSSAYPSFSEWAHEISMTTVIGLITYLSLVVGELVPKRLAMRHAELIAVRVAPIMRVVAVTGAPVVVVLKVSTNALLRLLRQNPDDTKAVTEDEVRAMIAEGTNAGIFAPAEQDMLDRVMRLADRTAGSIMTPRPDVEWLDADLSAEQWRQALSESRHARFPVARGSLDEVIGVLDTRAVLHRLLLERNFDIRETISEAPAVHEDTPALRILEMFRQTKTPMVLVLDEYGGFEGVVTQADVLEAISGSLANGDGDEGNSAVRRADGSWLIDGLMAVAEVESVTGLNGMAESGDFHTLAGFVLDQLAHLPQIGENFLWKGWRFEVVDMDGRRIDRVLMQPPAQPDETNGSGV